MLYYEAFAKNNIDDIFSNEAYHLYTLILNPEQPNLYQILFGKGYFFILRDILYTVTLFHKMFILQN